MTADAVKPFSSFGSIFYSSLRFVYILLLFFALSLSQFAKYIKKYKKSKICAKRIDERKKWFFSQEIG